MKYLMVTVSVLVFGIGLAGGTQAQSCRSEAGGYCADLAQISGTAQVKGLEFLEGAEPGQIIASLYVFGIGLVGVSALAVLIYAGIAYLTAGDSQEKTGKAKSYMKNAIFGLVLALLSWLILYTINPDFVRQLSLDLPKLDAPTVETREGTTTCEEIYCAVAGRCTTRIYCASL